MSAGAGLTTRGRCLLAAAAATAVCAVVLDERDLLRVAVFVGALPLLALAVTAGARVSLAAHRAVLPARVPVGAPAQVKLELSTRARVPGAELRLTEALPAALGEPPRFAVAALPRHGSTTLRYPLAPQRRGSHLLGPLVAQVADPFGLARFDRELAGSTRLLVVPPVVKLRGLPSGIERGGGRQGSGRMRSGRGEDDAIVRPFRDGDDMRRVHWRSTARRRELMVRVEERPWHGGVTVLLDRRALAHRGGEPAGSLEWTVSLAASICVHLLSHGQRIRLVTEDGAELASGADRDAVLDALATVPASPGREVRAGGLDGSGALVALLGAGGPGGPQQLLAARCGGVKGYAVVVDVGAWAGPGEDAAPDARTTAAAFADAGWRVSVGRPPMPFSEVWAELSGAAGVSPRASP